jgi:hypothetical protein
MEQHSELEGEELSLSAQLAHTLGAVLVPLGQLLEVERRKVVERGGALRRDRDLHIEDAALEGVLRAGEFVGVVVARMPRDDGVAGKQGQIAVPTRRVPHHLGVGKVDPDGFQATLEIGEKGLVAHFTDAENVRADLGEPLDHRLHLALGFRSVRDDLVIDASLHRKVVFKIVK